MQSSPNPPDADAGLPFQLPFNNSYARLPDRFFARTTPSRVAAPRLIQLNVPLAQALGLDPAALGSPAGVAVLAGNRVAGGSEPLAMAYAGHQFGHFVPRLGDGRANLLGEVIGQDGSRYDLQLKGAGRTPFSRGGDGRAALGPVLREYLVSEAMAALGVPTTRALAAVATGEPVLRERALPGAVLTRVAASHLRVGTFQFFAAQGDVDGVRTLANYAIARHYPEAAGAAKPYRALLGGVVARQAALVAQWMLVGFIHGVMNTDNTSISGETIDYGPCAFLESYEPAKVFSSIDAHGRYSYSNQPHAMHWNLARLCEALLPLLSEEEGSEDAAIDAAQEQLRAFGLIFEQTRSAGLRRKLGLVPLASEGASVAEPGDDAMAEELLTLMAAGRADFTLTFRRLCDAAADPAADRAADPAHPAADPATASAAASGVRTLFADPVPFDGWARRWHARLRSGGRTPAQCAAAMRLVNPAIVPRNHRVQAVIDAAVDRESFAAFYEMLDAVSEPFEERAAFARYTEPARQEELVQHTFCGT